MISLKTGQLGKSLPNGDEVVILLSGSATFVLQLEAEEKQITLTDAGSYVVIPQNIWHTVKVITQTKMIFITPGEGTQNRDV